MQILRVDLLLPRFYNPNNSDHSKRIEPAKIVQTLDEIEQAFGGYTLNDIPIIGSWIDPKTKKSFKDSHRSVWITVENNSENIRALKAFKEVWKERLEQEDIMIYYITMDTL
jgi:hypothetical protein